MAVAAPAATGLVIAAGGFGSIQPRKRKRKREVAVDPDIARETGNESSGVLVEYKHYLYMKTTQYSAKRCRRRGHRRDGARELAGGVLPTSVGV
jgi:hypothetical protein